MTVRIFAQLEMALGECPRWHAPELAWYWVDILGQVFYRYCTKSQQLSERVLPFQPACFVFSESGQILLSGSSGIYRLDDFSGPLQRIAHPEEHQLGQRFNDGTTLPNGDVIIGSIGNGNEPTGVRYRFRVQQNALTTHVLETGYRIINSQCCSPDGQWCYVADTPDQKVYRQAILADGELAGKELFYQCTELEFPDGAATDSHGNVWIAMYGSSQLVVINPLGEKIDQITLPAVQPTMLAFGGENRQDILITTARQQMPTSAAPENGSVLLMHTEFQGAAVNLCSRLG